MNRKIFEFQECVKRSRLIVLLIDRRPTGTPFLLLITNNYSLFTRNMFQYRVTLILIAIATALLLGLYFGLNHAQNGKKFPHPGLAVVAESADIPPLHSLRKWRGVTNAPFVPNVEVWGEGNIHPVFRFVSPVLILSVLVTFSFSTCFGLGDSGSKGDAPWALLASGIGQGTPSVSNPANTGSTTATGNTAPGTSTGSVSGPSGNTGSTTTPSSNCNQTANGQPVTGMFFLHPDHLGSITMITDTKGNPVTGDVSTGASRIAYRPYGEIDRQNSDRPDITRFKCTSQTEDSESSLMYYKARYYDPKQGVFLSPDAVVQPMSPNGMNRYAYVSGNPVNSRDPSGNWGIPGFGAALVSAIKSTNAWAGKSIGNTAAWMSTGLKNAANSYNHFTGQEKHKGSTWERSDIGKYPIGTKLFGKLDNWWGRSRGRDKYQNTDAGKLHAEIFQYVAGKQCEKEHGQNYCSTLFLANALDYGRTQDNYEPDWILADPFIGMWDVKIHPVNETKNGEAGSYDVWQIWELIQWIMEYNNQQAENACIKIANRNTTSPRGCR